MKKRTSANRLIERLLPSNEHGPLLAALATSYELDPLFVETDVLPAIFALGDWDERQLSSRVKLEAELSKVEGFTVMADARRYHGRPRSLRLEVLPRIGEGGKKLHAKVLLLVHERAVRVQVASANLTEKGYRENREVALSIVADAKHPRAVLLVRKAVATLKENLEPWWSPTAAGTVRRAIEVLDGLESGPPEDATFLWGGGVEPLWRRFVGLWPATEPVERITIVSPFWSEEKGADAPLTSLCSALAAGPKLAPGATLRLLAEAMPAKANTWRPRVPPVLDFDAASFGLRATIEAVDPSVPASELDDGTIRIRPLHAKVVLLEGPRTSLAYAGSGNFTRSGWGFLPAPGRANVEAGIALLDDSGSDRLARSLVPATTGEPITIGNSGGVKPDPRDDAPDPTFPTFIVKADLARAREDRDRLEFLFEVNPALVEGNYVVETTSDPIVELGRGGRGTGASARWPIDGDTLRRLCRDEQIRISWWASPEPRPFPLNVSVEVRPELPLVPGAANPDEKLLIQFFQGKLEIGDLVADPRDEADGLTSAEGPHGTRSTVDTTAIQAYQVREFVEAVHGLEAELRKASQASAAAMQVALLGAVSPTALAKAAFEACTGKTGSSSRSATAAGFQLAEIAGCLRAARKHAVEPTRREAWLDALDRAEERVNGWLEEIARRSPDECGPGTSFAKYRHAVLGIRAKELA